jgi:uncharacterized membrane protein
MTNLNIEEGKKIAVLSYILIIGVPIAMSMNGDAKNEFARFHIRQALGLSISFIALGLLLSNFNSIEITFVFWVAISVLWTYGIFTAIKGQIIPLPLIGSIFQKIFKNI